MQGLRVSSYLVIGVRADGLGANEIALDMFTRVGADFFRNIGRTLRLLSDGFSHKMSSEVR